MTDNKKKITETIKALLAKAAGTDNEHEAAIFAAKAHELMEKYQVSVGDVLKDDPVDMTNAYQATSSAPSYKKFLWRSLAHYYGCETMLKWITSTKYEVHLVGRESSRVTTELMFPFIMEQVRKEGRKIAQARGMKPEAAIRDVANALVIRIDQLVAEQKRKAPQPATVSGKNALIVTDTIKALMKKLYPNSKMSNSRSLGTNGDAKKAAAGISLNQQMGGGAVKRIT